MLENFEASSERFLVSNASVVLNAVTDILKNPQTDYPSVTEQTLVMIIIVDGLVHFLCFVLPLYCGYRFAVIVEVSFCLAPICYLRRGECCFLIVLNSASVNYMLARIIILKGVCRSSTKAQYWFILLRRILFIFHLVSYYPI